MELISTPRPQDGQTAAAIAYFVIKYFKDVDVYEMPTFFSKYSVKQYGHKSLMLIELLSKILNQQTEQAENDLCLAASTEPLYPTLYVIRRLLNEWNFEDKDVSDLRLIFLNIIEICKRISKIVSPIVSHAAPEGYIPDGTYAIGNFKILRLIFFILILICFNRTWIRLTEF